MFLLSFFILLSIHPPSIYLVSIYYRSIYLYIFENIYVCLLSIYFINLRVPIYLYISPSIRLSVYLSINLSTSISTHI
jgi:hypothetical protein